MARETWEKVVCDICGTDRKVKTWTFEADELWPKELDLCHEHSAPVRALYDHPKSRRQLRGRRGRRGPAFRTGVLTNAKLLDE